MDLSYASLRSAALFFSRHCLNQFFKFVNVFHEPAVPHVAGGWYGIAILKEFSV